ncbi:beta-N-acetylhexosaminidase [Bacillus sp. H-16]|uniref:beta-N-acetylhexosaminidase n=1 Tax=Alteribacter salitolerans TaxID=2912333 RepID=UPI0019636141|nr:beta-N-acetylhexosaminidase [Alteribacter salitolerans]MBM7094853.1 beta-N-acetylhexosaminidase [Alteribacter salitolerans]
MNIEEKVGRLMMIGIPGTTVDKETVQLVRDCYVGGVIYFQRNVESPAQVKELSERLQQVNRGSSPLLIAIDQEGGMVARIRDGVTQIPGQMAIGATGDPAAARTLAQISGKELAALGINVNFAPCADVNSNPANPVIGVRSFGSVPSTVASFVREAVAGFQESGVSATIKHFPGHGDTSVDSHLALPKLDHDLDRLKEVELAPFRAAASEADLVMSAHIKFNALDPDYPATLSKPIISRLLRDEIGFEGVAITDCMEMDAISKTYGTADAAVKAIQAGIDIVLVSHTTSLQRETHRKLVAAVKNGHLSLARVEEALGRIERLKAKHGTGKRNENRIEILVEKHRETVDGIRKRTISSLTDTWTPLSADEKVHVVFCRPHRQSYADEQTDESNLIAEQLRARGFDVSSTSVESNPSKEEVVHVLSQIDGGSTVVFCSYLPGNNENQRLLAKELSKHYSDMVGVSLRSPYDAEELPFIRRYITGFESTKGAMTALCEVLSGKEEPTGRVPITQ